MRQIFQAADSPSGSWWTFDDVQAWEPEDFAWLLEQGLLREGPSAESVYLWECDAQESFEPHWQTDREGNRIGLCPCAFCECVHTVKPERMRTWQTPFSTLALLLAQTIEARGEATIIAPDRIVRLGLIGERDGEREVYLVRGGNWSDGRLLLEQKLHQTNRDTALLLMLGQAPNSDSVLWTRWQMRSALEHLSVSHDQLRIELPKPSTQTTASPALSQAEQDVLDTLRERPEEPLLLVTLEARSGYGRHTVSRAVSRLTKLGLVARAGGGSRKGVCLTPQK